MPPDRRPPKLEARLYRSRERPGAVTRQRLRPSARAARMVIRVFMWRGPCVVPASKAGRASSVSILSVICIVSGVALVSLGQQQSERRQTLEIVGGILIIIGLVLIGWNLPLFR